jgi:hypothetical protein
MRITAEFLSARNMVGAISEVSGKKINLQEALTKPLVPFTNDTELDELQAKCVSVPCSSQCPY